MPHINKKRQNTHLLIMQLAAKHFVEDGYSNTSMKQIAKELDVSPGNVTFYFPSKEHMLAVLVDELYDFQKLVTEQTAKEGTSSLLAYCLELTVMAAACSESYVARDLYTSAYVSPMTLELVRKYDTEKTRAVFGEFRPDWDYSEWRATENIVSGIEYATITTREENTPLEKQIEKTLDSIMFLYGVPEEIRQRKIEKVLSVDYRALGRRIMGDFIAYIENISEENLKKSRQPRR